MIDRLVKEIEESLKHNLFFAALNLALTLPDICGKAEYPDAGTARRYKCWYDEYIGQYEKPLDRDDEIEMPYLSGEIVYNLRCSLLHSGNGNLDRGEYAKRVKKECPITRFSLVFQSEQPFHIYGGECGLAYIDWDGTEKREYSVSVRRLCMILCLGAKAYYDNNKEKFNFFDYRIVDWDKETARFGQGQNDGM